MKRVLLHSLTAALAGPALAVVSAALAAEPTAPQAAATEPVPEQAREQSAVAESVQPQVDEAATDEALEKRERIIAEATTAIAETRHALRALDEGKADEALQARETAVGKLELAEAETLAENRERSEEQEARLGELLEEARTQLELGRVLGYGDPQDYRPILEQLDEVEAKTAGGKGGSGWFDKIRRQISELL